VRARSIFDVYNLLNMSAVLHYFQTYGDTWRQPTEIFQGRLAKISVHGGCDSSVVFPAAASRIRR
jgi:hypothetical protein